MGAKKVAKSVLSFVQNHQFALLWTLMSRVEASHCTNNTRSLFDLTFGPPHIGEGWESHRSMVCKLRDFEKKMSIFQSHNDQKGRSLGARLLSNGQPAPAPPPKWGGVLDWMG